MARAVQWDYDSRSQSTTTSGRSDRSDSDRSYNTAHTEYTAPSILKRNETCLGRVEGHAESHFAPQNELKQCISSYTARSSIDTYASTSEEDLAEHLDDMLDFHVPQTDHAALPVDAIPTTPRDFADLFPTSKRLSIRHDDSTIDGNMNLRLDTQVEGQDHKKQAYTLFHLRMHDLRTREFSLRRYCRESGREVCHSRRKYQRPPPEKRPVLQRASTALASLKLMPDSRPSTAAGLKRSDSGYESMRGLPEEEDDSRSQPPSPQKARALLPTNTLKLEFSNYAQIDVKRRGAKGNKRYSFEYWGHNYSWKRIIKTEEDHESISYYLVRSDNDKDPLAHISPVHLTPEQAHEEAAMGGWIPQCYMRITDKSVLKAESDVSDVVVATGLMALVDDCIKRRFSSKQSTQLHIPLLRNKMHVDYVGPKRLIDEVFNRTGRSGPSNGNSSTLRRAATSA